MKAEDIRDMTPEEITDRIGQAQEELFRLRFRSATQPLESPALVKSLRRDIARMKTILRQQEMEQAKS